MSDNPGKRMTRESFQAPRGTRDFYPEQMAVLNWLFDLWRDTSRRHGFEEFDGPIFEHLDLYTIKSGEEIVSQLFNFEDRGGRQLAIRPELTPTLARMIAARANSLPRPIKWFSIPRACRAERPQRGRLREFFQWNVDVVGSESILADAECIFVLLDFLRVVGLDSSCVELRVNSRTIISSLLEQGAIEPQRHEHVFSVMDKYERLDREAFRDYAREQQLSGSEIDLVMQILDLSDLADVETLAKSEQAKQELGQLKELQNYLVRLGVGDYFSYRSGVVRGLAYYTGIVFEIFDRSGKFRAVAGGGRYDKLIAMFGGPSMPAVGFGLGDAVLMELLRDLGKLPSPTPHRLPDFYVADTDPPLFDLALTIVGRLRAAGLAAEFSYKRQGLSKQLKQAGSRGAKTILIVGSETQEKQLITIKNLSDGSQQVINLESLLANPAAYLSDR